MIGVVTRNEMSVTPVRFFRPTPSRHINLAPGQIGAAISLIHTLSLLLHEITMARTKQQARRSTGPYPSKRSFGGNSKARSIPLTPFPLPADQDNEALAPFEAVSRNLAKIGSLTIGHFLQSPADAFDVPYHIQDNRLETSPTPPPALSATISKQPIPADGPSKMKCVAQLHHACQRAFGKTDLLKFEFIEVDGPNSESTFYTLASE